MILRAAVVLPVSRPAIRNGAVVVSGNRITAVGPWRDLRRGHRDETLDLGESVLLPGLINAHCHLDYTGMAGLLPPPKVFTDWLKLLTATKAGWSVSEFAHSWRSGAEMLVYTGTTTVGDIEAVPQLLPEAWKATPLRVVSFLEMICVTSRRTPQAVLKETLDHAAGLGHARSRLGLSPHAPYTAIPELVRLSAQAARRRRWPLCIHVSESALEYRMFTQSSGEMFDWLRRSGRDMSDCGSGSPLQCLEKCGALDGRLLAAHANYLGKKDLRLLARRKVHVVHCPRSYAYFRHEAFPLRRLLRAKVNVCLGTDSLASVEKTRRQIVELSLFDEMRALATREPSLPARTILRMVTVNGARALSMTGQVGELTQGAFADLVALPLNGNGSNIYEAVLAHKGHVSASMIGGQWAIAPAVIQGELPNLWRHE